MRSLESDARSELYLMEKLYEYKMVESHSVVERAHEIQALAKELEYFHIFFLTSLWLAISSPSYHLFGRILPPP
jgi:transposase